MSDGDLPATTQALIQDIERKDRRFRVAQAVFFVLIAGLLTVLLVGNYRQGDQNQKVIAGQTKTLKTLTASAKQRTEQIGDLQKHIDCIVALFQEPNRASLIITDIENCSLQQLQASSFAAGNQTTKN